MRLPSTVPEKQACEQNSLCMWLFAATTLYADKSGELSCSLACLEHVVDGSKCISGGDGHGGLCQLQCSPGWRGHLQKPKNCISLMS